MMLAYLDNQSLTGTGNGSRKRARHGSSSSGAREDSPHGGNNPFNDYFGLRVCPTNGIGPPLLPYGGSIGSVERVGIAASASQGGPAVVPPPPVSSFSGQHSPTIDVSLPGPSPAMATGRRRDTPGGQTEEQDRPTDRGTVSPKSKGVHVEVPGVSAAMSLPFPVTFGTFDPTRGDHVLRRPPFTTECSYPGCSGRLEYDGEGNVSGTFCPRHRSNNLVSENLYCKEPGCKKPPRLGDGNVLLDSYCSDHKRPAAIELNTQSHLRGAARGELTSSVYGREVDLALVKLDRAEIKEDRYSGGLQSQTTCLHEGCSRMSRFSLRGKEKSVGYFCSMHKLKGMVNVRHRLCNQEGCNVIPSFGFESEGSKPRFCAYHKLKGMVDVRNPRCQHKDCNRVPSYGFKGGKRTFCSTHKQDDMVNLVQAHCKEAGCQRKPVYGQVWLKRPNLCEVHWANATVLPLAKKGWAPPPTVLTQGVSTDSATSATAPPITNTTSPAQANGQIVGNTAGASELKGDMPQKRDTEGLVK
ncbi:unnamed protein product [Discosporangium mesarthrocarpum]